MAACLLCSEPLIGDKSPYPIHTPTGKRYTHASCSLREVMGGIGHLIAHEYWCVEKGDPDAGLTYYQSAIMVRDLVSLLGVDAVVKRGEIHEMPEL